MCLKMPHVQRGADLNAEYAYGINHAESDCALSTVSTKLTKERKKVPKKERKHYGYYFLSPRTKIPPPNHPYPFRLHFPYPLQYYGFSCN
jgi:hypothetical protein